MKVGERFHRQRRSHDQHEVTALEIGFMEVVETTREFFTEEDDVCTVASVIRRQETKRLVLLDEKLHSN